MATSNYPLNNSGSYIRVQTNYYQKCLQPTIHGDFIDVWALWSGKMLKQYKVSEDMKALREMRSKNRH